MQGNDSAPNICPRFWGFLNANPGSKFTNLKIVHKKPIWSQYFVFSTFLLCTSRNENVNFMAKNNGHQNFPKVSVTRWKHYQLYCPTLNLDFHFHDKAKRVNTAWKSLNCWYISLWWKNPLFDRVKYIARLQCFSVATLGKCHGGRSKDRKGQYNDK